MDIDMADALPKQMVAADEVQDLHISGDADLRQVRQSIQDNGAPAEIAEGEFADDKGVRQRPSCIEQVDERLAPGAEMVYPNRGIDQNHAGRDRRRGGAFNPLSLPPSFASRRALSRSISAL